MGTTAVDAARWGSATSVRVMSLKFSKIVPRLARGEAQRKPEEGAPAPAPAESPEPEAPQASEPKPELRPELEPEAPIEVATEFVSAPKPAAAAEEEGPFDLGDDASQFAEDLLERAVGAQAEAAPHPDAAPEPEPAATIPKSFGFDFDVDPDAPQSELAKAVSSALSEDPPSPFPDDEDDDEDDGEVDDEVDDENDDENDGAASSEIAADWLDQPAGPGVRPGPVRTNATETVDRRDTPAPPAPPAPAPPATPADIANELMLAADAGDTPPGGVPAAELERLLSSALEEEGGAASAAAPAADGPALDPSQVAPGDFRGLAAGLIAELEASLHPATPRATEDRS